VQKQQRRLASPSLIQLTVVRETHRAQRIEHEDLTSALSLVGIKPPSRRDLMGVQLAALYESTRQNAINTIQAEKCVAVTMDGWKKRVAEQGAPLVTVNFLMPDGGAKFWKVWIL
jgi:hypothetical protein